VPWPERVIIYRPSGFGLAKNDGSLELSSNAHAATIGQTLIRAVPHSGVFYGAGTIQLVYTFMAVVPRLPAAISARSAEEKDVTLEKKNAQREQGVEG
jgi:hypothetical protein